MNPSGMATNQSLEYNEIPLSALKQSTLVTLSASLNQHKVIPTDDGLPRDWRGVAQLIGLNGLETNKISAMPDSFSGLVEHWGNKGSVMLLQKYLTIIDRYDVLDDVEKAITKDILDYEERLKKIDTAISTISIEADKNILTIDDVIRLEKGLEPQLYDAYVLYAEEDVDFASEIIETMENKYNFKFCVRDRDLIGGVQFEHDAITKLIAERCRRLVVIVSSNFLKSKANKFFVTFAQALGIDIRERKVIPILYERCEVPPELSYYFLLDYNRAGKLWNFWDKLRDSIQAPEGCRTGAPRMTGSSVTSKTGSDLWISRTQFEKEGPQPSAYRSDVSFPETRRKKDNIYKIIKKRFKMNKKSSTGPTTRDGIAEVDYETSLIDHLSNLVPNDEVPFHNLNNSTSFDSKDEYSPPTKEKTKNVKKKNFYKKRPVDAFVS